MYERDEQDSDSEVERDWSKDHRRSCLDRAKQRMDLVAMNLERRVFHAEMATDAILAINVYSDARPTVGAEIQGMLVDFIKRDDTVRTCVLPGATLDYGHADVVSKTMSFVYAVWLVCGPLLEHLRYFFKGAHHNDGLWHRASHVGAP